VGLHARRRIDDVAADQRLPGVPDGGEVDQHLAGGDADPDPHRGSVRQHQAGQRLLDFHSRQHGPVRVVLVGVGCAEHREHRVADVLLHDALPAADDLADPPEEIDLEGPDVLGVQPCGEHGEPRDVDEQHAHPATLLARTATAAHCHAKHLAPRAVPARRDGRPGIPGGS
jgi:hypothetical protein